MKPVNIGGHSAYQDRVLTQLRKYYPNAATSLSSSTWQILDKFWNLDLSQVDALMQDRYSVFGPEPRLPSDMLRAILVSVAFKITSYTKLASDKNLTNAVHPPLNFRRGSRCPKIAFWQSKFPKNGSLSINYCDIFEKIV